MRHLRLPIVVLAVLSGACEAAPHPNPADDDRQRNASQRVTSAAQTPNKLDMDAIFPPGDGRDLVLDNCLTCHGFPRIVLTQRSTERWASVRESMGARVPSLTPEQVERLFAYLETNFSDQRPEPPVPRWFLDAVSW